MTLMQLREKTMNLVFPLKSSTRRLLSSSAFFLTFVVGQAVAQDEPLEEITVVGSQIKGASIEGALPVTVVDSELLDSADVTTGDELLRSIPQIGSVGFGASRGGITGVNAARGDVALRRAALGVIRIVIEADLRLPLRRVGVDADLLSFFHDRLKVYLRDKGVRHDVIDAVLNSDADDLAQVAAQAQALNQFVDTEDGGNLLAGYKRAANILAAEEKSAGRFA